MNLIFEKETKYGIFKSSLNVKDDALPEEIEQIKSNLVSSWIQMIENPVLLDPLEEIEHLNSMILNRRPQLKDTIVNENLNNG